MSEQTMPYSYGTEVWVKVVNRYWWPGVVVDPLTIPDELLEYVNKVNPIAVVKFEQEEKYEVVVKEDKITPYSCPLKMDHIKRGISLHKNQKRGVPLIGKFDMDNFRNDVVAMERRIGGDIFIFENLEKSEEHLRSIKQCFAPTIIKKPKKREVGRKSLSAPKPKELPSTPQSKRTPVSKQKTSPPSRVVKLSTPIRTPITSGYACHVKANCTYSTNRYDLLKRHMAMHKNDVEEKIVKKSPSSGTNKRKNLKNKLSDAKKIKLQNELLKDWENDGDDEDGEFDTSIASTRSEVGPSTSNVVPTIDDVIPTIKKVLPSKSDDLSISNAVEELLFSSSNILDFNKNDNITPVVEHRQSKSDSSVDNISDTFELQSTSEILNHTAFKTSSKESPLVVEIKKNPSNGPHKLHSNEFTNKNDDQTKNTELLLEKTVNTLDQITHFESSLSGISDTINKSDSNILTKADNIIDVPELNEVDSLKEPTKEPSSPNKDIHSETDNIIDIVENMSIQTENHELVENISIQTENCELVENMSIQTENHELVKEDPIDIETVSNLEVNQSTDTTMDKDMPIENSSSLNSISSRIDSEDETTLEKDNVECLLDAVEEPDWTKDDNWRSYAENGLKEAKLFATVAKKQKYLPSLDALEPIIENNSFEPVYISEEIKEPTSSVIYDVQKVLLPYAYSTSTEELRADANVQALQAAVMNGGLLEIIINRTSDIISYPAE